MSENQTYSTNLKLNDDYFYTINIESSKEVGCMMVPHNIYISKIDNPDNLFIKSKSCQYEPMPNNVVIVVMVKTYSEEAYISISYQVRQTAKRTIIFTLIISLLVLAVILFVSAAWDKYKQSVLRQN